MNRQIKCVIPLQRSIIHQEKFYVQELKKNFDITLREISQTEDDRTFYGNRTVLKLKCDDDTELYIFIRDDQLFTYTR